MSVNALSSLSIARICGTNVSIVASLVGGDTSHLCITSDGEAVEGSRICLVSRRVDVRGRAVD